MALSLKSKKEKPEKPKAEKKPKRAVVPKSSPGKKGGKQQPAGKGKGGRRFVLIIGDEGAILVLMQGAKVLRRLFAQSPQPSHTEVITEIMIANPKVPLYILIDVLDQQYVPHTFPPVSSLSVGGLVKRRLDRDFQPEDLKGALPLGREKTGRKEWKYILVSLAKTPLFNDWLERLVELPNELKGIYLVPIESVNYINALAKQTSQEKSRDWQLLISHNKVSGFRQVVTHRGRLVFTRVSQAIDDAIPAVIAGNIEQEIINTIEYLKRLEFRENTDLDAYVIVSQDVLDTLDLKRFGFASATTLTPMQVADMLSLEQAALSADRFGDVVMASSFGVTKKHLLRFSNAYIDKLAKLYKARLAIKLVSTMVAAGLVLAAVGSAVGMLGNYSAISESQTKLSNLQPQIQQAQKSVDMLNQDVTFKSAVVATYEAYVKNTPKPEEFVRDFIPLLEKNKRIKAFEWSDDDATDEAGGKSTGAPNALPIDIRLEVDFAGGGNKLDQVDKAANDFMAALKSKMSRYDVESEPFPWVRDQSQANETIEINAANAVTVQNAVGVIKLKGIKPANGGGAGNP